MVLIHECLAIIIDAPYHRMNPPDNGLVWTISPSFLEPLDVEGTLIQQYSAVGYSASSSLTGFLKENIKKNTNDEASAVTR